MIGYIILTVYIVALIITIYAIKTAKLMPDDYDMSYYIDDKDDNVKNDESNEVINDKNNINENS